MPNSWFKFKQFTVWQDIAAMKVGTDGVLLGAWANADHATRVLDLGTGTGLIALMIAQRFQMPRIHAIDVDPDAIQQATENFKRSSWSDRLSAQSISFQEFVASQPDNFDHIVSNPPYFKNSLHAPDKKRTLARHTASLSFSEILKGSSEILSPTGKLSLIVPYEAVDEILQESASYNLFCHRQLFVKPKPEKGVVRVLLELNCTRAEVESKTLVIELEQRHNYSQAYKDLTHEFYLKF